MSKNMLRATALVVVAVPILSIANAGLASAYPAPTVEAGRGRIQVTAVPAIDLVGCQANYDGGAWSPGFGAGDNHSTLFENVPAGSHEVWVACMSTMNTVASFGPTVVDVTAANPMLDAADKALAGAGSSALTTDPTLK